MQSPVLSRPPPAAATSSSERDPWFDNAKFLLVTFVVIGHSWTLISDIGDLYSWLYLWHVPAFVLVTGYLSRSFRWTKRHLHRLGATVLFPYLVFEGLFALMRHYVGGVRFEALWLNPHWPMWYLSVLLIWRMATPVLLRVPFVVPLSIVVSLVGGFASLTYFDGNRALGLLPFFVVGLVAQPHHVQALRRTGVRVAGVAALLGGIAVAKLIQNDLDSEWQYFRTPYADLDALGWGGFEGVAIRAMLLAVGFAMALGALSLIPARRTFFSAWGAASLVVYLFHGFFVLGAEFAGFPGWAEDHRWVALTIVTLASVVVSVGLSMRTVARRLDKVVTPPPLQP